MKHLLVVILTGITWTSSLGQIIHDNTSLEKKGLEQLENNLSYVGKLNFNLTYPKHLSLGFLNQRANSMYLTNDPMKLVSVPDDLTLRSDIKPLKYYRRSMADVFHSKVFKIALFAALAVSFKFHNPVMGK